MRLSRLKALGGFILAAILSSPAWGASLPQPGTLNYYEGQVTIGTSAIKPNSIGSAHLKAGQTLTAKNGKAEILLTPGVFLRLDDNSSVKMISPTLANTKVRLVNGQAMVEVDEIYKANDIHVLQDGASVRLLKTGLYGFDARQGEVRVFKGQALVREGNRHVKLGGDRQVSLNTTGKLKSKKFDKKVYEGSLYRFSKLRSDYLADANVNASKVYVSAGYWPGWYGYGTGWFWDPWLNGYTFFPGSGVLYSPFGFGFYSPFAAGPYFYHHRFMGFDDHPDFRPGVVPHPGDNFAMGRPVAPTHGPRVMGPGIARGPDIDVGHGPDVDIGHGIARGPAMGMAHMPGGFHGVGGGFHGGAFHGRVGGGFHR
jgi:hypothetical protein